jgi:hypothetical protein
MYWVGMRANIVSAWTGAETRRTAAAHPSKQLHGVRGTEILIVEIICLPLCPVGLHQPVAQLECYGDVVLTAPANHS